ncbi:MAG: hypothetical protein KJ623_01235 [Nanoarchaeota archaeon]|nr:hypothetical protein [Nanoarchaeota archaeon]MBU0962737.1 hypothetical protein [Nanoarchaeota archaeon]
MAEEKTLIDYLTEFKKSLVGKTFIYNPDSKTRRRYKIGEFHGIEDLKRINVIYEADKYHESRHSTEPFNTHLDDLEVKASNSQ